MATDFGRDTSCTDSLRTGRLSSGPRLVAEACYRRLITPRGMLRGGVAERNYGLDLATAAIGLTSAEALAILPGLIREELQEDERVLSAEASIAASTVGAVSTLAISIRVITSEGPFTLKLSVSEVSVTLLGMEA